MAENLRLGSYVRPNADGVNRDSSAVLGHFPVLEQRQRQQAGNPSAAARQQMLAIARALMLRPKRSC